MEKSYKLPVIAGKYFFLISFFILASFIKIKAAVTVTAPTLTINTCSVYPTDYHTLGNIVITEGANSDFAVGTNVTLILTAPANYQFLAGAGSVAVTAGNNLSGESVVVTSTTITVTYTSGGTNKGDVMTISGIQVRATAGPGTQTATRTGGTGTIAGLVSGTVVATFTSANVSSPVGGTAVSSLGSTVCNNSPTTLSVNGGTDGTSVQWQSSPDNVTFTNISGATSFTYVYTPTVTSTMYFRRVVTCGTTVNSSSVVVNSQVCDCSTGGCSAITINVDLSSNPDTTYVLTGQTRNGLCCLQTGTKCIRFNITVNPLSDLINFQVANPAPPGGAFYQIDCGAPTSLGTPACISGGTHCIVFCKSGGDSPTYTIVATRTINASPDITVRQGCPGALSVTGLQPASITWTSINPGAAGAYNSYLSCSSGCANTTVTPGVGSPSFIDYMVTGTPNTTCTGTSRDTIRVNVVPGMTVAITPTNPVLCSAGPGSVTLTATPTGGAPPYSYSWSTGATTQSISVSSVGTYTVNVSDATVSCPPIQATITVVANPTPAAPTASGTTICTGSTATLTATAPGGTYEWYSAASGGTLLATAASYTTPVLTTTTTYYVQTTSGGCTSPRTAVTVTVSSIPAAPTAAGTTICQGSSATLNATAPGGTYDWYDAATGGTLLFTGATYTTPALAANTTYYVQTTVAGCAGPRTAVTVTVTPTPVAPTASGVTICEGNTATLTATAPGGTYTWYDAASGGSLLFTGASYTTPALTANTSYYVQTTVSGCPGPRTAVTVTVTPIPVAPTAAGTTICTGTTATLTATAPGGTYAWYNAASGGTLLVTNASYTTPVLTATTTYYVQTTVSGCPGPRTAVTVTVSPVPAAPTAAGASICTGTSTTLTATAPGGTYEWYDAASGGTLLATAASYTTPVLNSTTTYYVQTTVAGCAGPRTAVTVTVSPVPAAPTASGASICSGNTATLTATAPGGTYTWYDAAAGGTLLATASSYTTPVLTSTTTYYVQTTVSGCTGPRTAVTVTVNSVPAAPTALGTTICQGTTATLTATAPGGTYAWYDAASGGTLLVTNASYTTPALNANTTFYVETTVGSCTGPRTAVTVTVTPTPAAPTASGTTICQGSTATLNATAPGGTYAWYDAASGGTLLATAASYTTPALSATTTYYVQTTVSGCAGPRTAVTVTVTPTPAAPTAAGTTICQGTSTTLSATAPGGTYAWYNAASGGTLLVTNANYTTPVLNATTTYYVQTTISGCVGPRTAVTVTVTPIPAAPTAAGATICSGNTATLTATAPGGTYEWYSAASGGTLLVTNASYTTPALTTTTTYYVQTTVSGCAGPRTAVIVTVNPIPAAPAAAGATICTGTSTTLTATAPGGTYAWYDAASGGTLLVTATNYTTPVLTATTTYYVQTTVSGCASPRTAVTVTVSPVPAAPTASGASICTGTTATLIATAPGGTYQWYDAASGGTLLVTAASYTTPVLTATTTYYVQTTVAGCTGPRTAVTVTVSPIPAAPTASGTTICSGSTTTLTATAPGGTYEWYDAASGGTLLVTNASYTTPALTSTTTYYVQTTVSGCTGPRTAVTVTVNPIPAAPTAASVTRCSGSTATLTATAPGGSYQWYDAASGGTLLASTASYTTPALTATTSYYVQTTVGGCTSPRTTVTVTINPIPAAPTASGTTICQGTSTVLSATAPGGTYAWYTAATGGTLLVTNANYTTPVLNANTTYYVQTTVGGCTSPRTAVTVTVTPTPAAPTAAGTTICSGSTATLTATAPGGTYEWYSAATGGTLLIANASYTTPALTSTTTYYVQTTISGCAGPRTAVTVTVNPIPVAPTVTGSTTICEGNTTTLTATAPGGTYEWYSAASGGTLLATNAAYTTPVLSSTTTYYVQTTVSGCTGPRTAVTVIVNPTPAAPTVSGTTICQGNSATLTATAPGGTYDWYDAASGGTLLATSNTYTTPSLSATTTYYVQSTISGCAGPRTAVTVTVTSTPAAPTAAGATICSGSNATLTATAPGGTYEWYSAASGGSLLATNASYTTPSLTATTTYYVETTISGCTGPRTAVTVTVNPIPAAPTAANATICSGSTATLTATAPGGSYQWYDAASGGSLLASSTSYVTPALTATTTYYVQTTISGCTGPRTAVTVAVNPIPAAPTANGTTICQGTTATLTATAPGGIYRWFPVPTGGTALVTAASYTTPALSATTTYYVQTTVGGCTSPRTAVTVTVTPTPASPTAAGITICEGNSTTLTATAPGGAYEWYSAATGGTLLGSAASFTTPTLSATTTYYVQTTISGCTGPRTAVTVTVNPTDDPSFNYSSGTYCITGTNPTPVITGGSTGIFSSTPSGLVFTNTATGTINLSGSALNTYTVTFTTSGSCSAASTANITITNAPSAVFSYATPYCQNDPNTLPTFAAGASAGIFSATPAGLTFISTSTGEIDLAASTPGTYSITNNIAAAGGCAAATATSSITINLSPQVNAGVNQTICEGTTASMSATIGGSAISATWSGGTGSFSSNTSLTAVYTPGPGETSAQLILTTNDPAGPCNSVSDTLIITITPTPLAPTASGATICSGNTTTLTATAPGGIYEWYDAATGGTLLITNASFTTPVLTATTTYYVQTTIAGCAGPRTSVTVTVNPIPAAPTASGASICTGGSATVTATAPGGTYDWYDASTGGTLLMSNASYTTPALTSTTTYYVQSTISGCTGPRTAVTVTVNPIPAAPTAANITVCTGSSGTVTATAPGGTYQWYDAASGGTLLASTASYTTPPLTSATTFYVQSTIAGCTGPRTAVTVNVNPIPAAPTANGTTICQGTSVILSATAPGGTYRWFSVPTGGSVLFTGANYTTPVLNSTTTYYVQTTSGGCTSPRTAVTVTVTPTPAAPTAANETICSGSTASLTATAPGGSYEWYSAATGGTLLSSAASYTTPSLTTTTSYYVQTTISGCTSPRTVVTVTVNPIEVSTFSYSSGTYCFTGTNPVPTITGAPGTFSSSPSGLVFVSSTTGEINLGASLLNTYSVTYTTSGTCSSSSITSITITDAPSAAFTYNTPYCQVGANPVPSFGTGASAGIFSTSMTGLTFANTTTGEIDLSLSTPGTYTVTNDIAAAGGCAAATATSSITINQSAIVNAGPDRLICGSGTTTLAGSIGGAATSGTWSGGTGTFSNSSSMTPVYTPGAGETSATLILTSNDPAGPCSAISDTVIVTVNPIPAAPTAAGTTICQGTSAILTASAPGGIYQWFNAPSGGTLLASGTSFTTPVLTATTTYYVQTNIGGCAGPRTAVTVLVTPTENSSFSYSSGTFCVTGSNPSPTTATGVTGTFSASPAGLSFINTATGEINLAASSLNTYTVTFTSDGSCPSSSTVNVTITTAPNASFAYSGPYCPSGANPFPSFTAGASAGIFSASPAGLNFVNSSTGEINLSTSAPGTYSVTNDIAAAGGCAAATATSTVIIDPLPTVNANSDQTVCSGSSVTLAGIIGGSATSATWSGGTGSFSSNTDLNATYTPATGETSVTLTLTTNDPAGSCTSVSDNVTINFQIDSSTFSYSSSAYCSSGTNPVPLVTGGYTGTFTSSPAGLVFISSTTGEINLSASALNTYSVTFTSNGVCPNSTSVNVTITNGFDATFSYTGPYCQSGSNPVITLGPGANAGVFSATPAGLNFISTSTGEVDLTNTVPGTYNITNFIAASGGCASATSSAMITIEPAAIVNAGLNVSICVGSTVTLAGSTGGSATSASWSGGLGSFSSNSDLNAIYTPAVGETSVLLILTSNDPSGPCGAISDSMMITINPIPAAPTVSDTTICSGESTTLTAVAPGGTYQWYDAPGGTLLITNAVYTTPVLTANATYYVQTTIAGCTSPQTAVNVTVNPPAIVNAGVDQTVCSNNAVVTLSGTLTNVTGATWSTTGGGLFNNDSLLNATYTPDALEITAGSATLILTSYGNCAPVSDTIIISFSPAPVVNAGPNQFICTGTLSASLNGSVSGGASTGQWTSLGDGTFSVNDTMLNATYTLGSADIAAGGATLILTSTNFGNCVSVSDTMQITITTIPATNAGNDTIVCGNNPLVQLNGTITGGSGMGIWSTNGDGTFSPSDSALNAIYSPGTADIANGSVVLILTPFNSCLPVQDSVMVTITAPIIVNAGNNQTVCSSVTSVSLNGIVSGGTTTGNWTTIGDGSISPSADSLNIVYTFGTADTTAGSVTLILTSTNNGLCSAISDTVQILIITNPVVNAGNDTLVCGNNPDIQLNGSISLGQGLWSSSGTGMFTPSDSVMNAIYSPDSTDIANGSVVLTLTPFNSCVAVSDSIVVTITPPTIVNAGNNQTVCSTVTSINLTGSISGGTTTGTWSTIGTGTFSPATDSLNVTYTFSSADTTAGSVMLVLTSSNNGICSPISDSILITISNSTVAFAGNDTTVCANNSQLVLNGILTGGTTAVWSSSGTGIFAPSDSVLNATYTPSAADITNGNIILILTPVSACTSTPDSLTLLITPAPVVDAGKDTTICGGFGGITLSGTVDAIAAGGFWTTNGNGSFSPNDSTLNATYIPGIVDADTLVFVLTSFGNGLCNPVNDTVIVIRNVQPSAAFSATNMCAGQAVVFNDSSNANGGTITNWSWDFGSGGSTSVLQNPTFTYPSEGSYTVTLTVSSGTGCSDSVTQMITINPVPVAGFNAASTCQNSPLPFTDVSTISTGSITVWSWNFDDGNTSAIQNPVHYFSLPGVYNVVLSVTSNTGCTGSFTQTVTISPLPVAGFTSTLNCGSLTVNFTDTSSLSSGNMATYNWTFGDGGTSTLQDPAHDYSTAGNYMVTLVVISDNGCIDTATASVDPVAPVTADYTPNGGSYNVNQLVGFDNQSNGAITYIWNFDDGSSTTDVTDPSHGFVAPGTYAVSLIATNSIGCSDTVSYDFVVNSTGSAAPTGFTPNGDGLNDYFYILGNFTSYELRVFNEWGNQIFMSTDQNNKWDGTFKGKEQPAGTYVYIFNGKVIDGSELKMNGEVNLIR
jgi:large repetitive protein